MNQSKSMNIIEKNKIIRNLRKIVQLEIFCQFMPMLNFSQIYKIVTNFQILPNCKKW